MKRLAIALLATMLGLVALGGCSANCAGGSNRGMFCGTGTRF